MTTILSIQSSVAYGHVGNSAAAFTLMRMGVETYPVLTVHYSNTTGYGSWRGPVLSATDVMDVVRGVDERGALTGVDALLTGFQGSEAMGNTILDAVDLVKTRNPKAVYCCDPVMGDVGRGMYVAPGIPEFLRDKVVPRADIVIPNQFELDFLVGQTTRTVADLLAGIDTLIARGPTTVLVTSAMTEEGGDDTVSMVAATAGESWLVSTPRIDQVFTGSGDVTSAVFLAYLLQTGRLDVALAQTAGIVYSVLDATARAGQRELALVAAQDQIVSPSHAFEARRLR
ncbi:MAG: pyridoxal kinase PdxY [Propionibacteriaceae bacterium]|jgi:pyridoxine kinase|nr:pyridoxal kinase PdxY [Propionibacteriaceae bacterium]